MTRNRFRLMVVSIPILAFALALPCVAAAAVVFNSQIPFSVVVANPCPPGNPIAATGNFHLLVHFTADSNGGFHGDLSSNVDDYSAVDTVTGTKYQAHQNGQTNDAFPPTFFKFNNPSGAQLEFTQDFTVGLESQGSVPNLNLRLQLHVTVNANGDVTAVVTNFRFTCK